MTYYLNELLYKINKIFSFDNDKFDIKIPENSDFHSYRTSPTRKEIRNNSLRMVWIRNIGLSSINDFSDNHFKINSYDNGGCFLINGEFVDNIYKNKNYDKTLLEFILEYGRGSPIEISINLKKLLEDFYYE